MLETHTCSVTSGKPDSSCSKIAVGRDACSPPSRTTAASNASLSRPAHLRVGGGGLAEAPAASRSRSRARRLRWDTMCHLTFFTKQWASLSRIGQADANTRRTLQ